MISHTLTDTMSPTRTGPLLPVKNRTESFWLTKRDKELCNARTTATLPKTADVVVIGSGLSGAMTSYLVLEEARAKGMKLDVVMLEADETCGSSTARNGEPIRPELEWTNPRRPLQARHLHRIQQSQGQARQRCCERHDGAGRGCAEDIRRDSREGEDRVRLARHPVV